MDRKRGFHQTSSITTGSNLCLLSLLHIIKVDLHAHYANRRPRRVSAQKQKNRICNLAESLRQNRDAIGLAESLHRNKKPGYATWQNLSAKKGCHQPRCISAQKQKTGYSRRQNLSAKIEMPSATQNLGAETKNLDMHTGRISPPK